MSVPSSYHASYTASLSSVVVADAGNDNNRANRCCSFAGGHMWEYFSETYSIQATCIIIMLECAFIALTGRGVISILQAIICLIFAIEGFWGAIQFDAPSIRRYLIFLCVDFVAALAVGIIDLQTVGTYCATADDADYDNCSVNGDCVRDNVYYTQWHDTRHLTAAQLLVLCKTRETTTSKSQIATSISQKTILHVDDEE